MRSHHLISPNCHENLHADMPWGEAYLHLGHALEVRLAGRYVLLIHLLRQVKHVRREERLAVLGEVLLFDMEHDQYKGQQY